MKTSHRFSLVLAFAVHASLANAAPPSTSDYSTDVQNSHVEDETSRGIGQVNVITCIMSSMRPEALVNKGPYNALVDQTKCDPEARGGGGEAAQSAAFMRSTVNATRASNSEPMISKIWIDEEQEGEHASIFVHVSATEAPSTGNPYGLFRLDYCAKGDGMSQCMSNGFLRGSSNGISYFENEANDEGGAPTIKALQLNASGTTSGSGSLDIDGEHESARYDFAYNASLFRRSSSSGDQCFSRDASDADTGFSVWRYGLYDETTGARVTRNSGFPIEYTNSGTKYQGYLGYYGLQLPFDAMNALTNGSTVQKVDYGSGDTPTKTDFTVVKSDGKLTKYTKHVRTLESIDRIKFMTFTGNGAPLFVGAQQNSSYELYWDNSAGDFKVSAQFNCDQNGCRSQALQSQPSVAVSYWQSMGGVQGSSQSLGGELFIALNGATGAVNAGAINVVYRTQDLVYPSQMPAKLFCVRDCPTAASMEQFFMQGSQQTSPYAAGTANNWNPSLLAAVVAYDSAPADALLKDPSAQPVVFTDGEAIQEKPMFQHGIRSGRLFTELASAECSPGSNTYCDYKVNDLDVYYQWETGANAYSHFAAVKNASGTFVQFDAPLNVTFAVPNTSAYGEYAGQSLVLQYGGFGDLWGIPGQCVDRSSNQPVSCENGDNIRYVAAFVVPFDTTVGRVTEGGTTYLVKWLDREIRFANKSTAVCDAAGLAVPTSLTLPTAADLKNPSDSASDVYIGARPDLNDAPRVINGEVKY